MTSAPTPRPHSNAYYAAVARLHAALLHASPDEVLHYAAADMLREAGHLVTYRDGGEKG